MKKLFLISIDAMRPDGFLQCKNPYVETLMANSTYCLDAQTVNPSVTLPAHLSIFHSVPPERHGTTNNIYMHPVRPVNGIFEQIKACGGVSAMFYGWQQMRDVCSPGCVVASEYVNSRFLDNTDTYLTSRALEFTTKYKPDFVYLYLPETDDKGGHDVGWMSEKYFECVSTAIENVKRVIEALGDEYTVIVTADHGGHDRTHGTLMPEDMTIPMFFCGDEFEKGRELHGLSILDIAPTVASVMGVAIPEEWEGKSII